MKEELLLNWRDVSELFTLSSHKLLKVVENIKILLKCNLNKAIERLKKLGFKRSKYNNGYIKNIKTGRFHCFINEINNQLYLDMHFDKYKHKSKTKYKHSTRYIHPLVKKELDRFIKEGIIE